MKLIMKKFILFFSIALSVYGLLNFYVFIHGWHVIPPGYRIYYTITFWFLAFAFVAGRIWERQSLSVFSESLTWIGSFWLAAFIYLFLSVWSIDTFLLFNSFFPFVSFNPPAVAITVVGLTATLVMAGYVNARMPRIRILDISIQKKVSGNLTIAVASDIHLGTIIGRSRLDRIVRKINSLNADIVLLPGDVVDEDLAPVIKENLGESLRNIKSKWGVYSVTGNHEYIGGVEEASRYLTEHGICVLRDEVKKIDSRFYVVGREDRSYNSRSGRKRKLLKELTDGLDRDLPVIMMDHQPANLDEAVEAGIDLQLSGHTHHGQLWPFNYITKKVFEVSRGYKKKGSTHFYVSNGVGTWGPPVRIGNRPEIVCIHLNFLHSPRSTEVTEKS